MNADRFLVALGVQEVDLDKITGLDHLRGRLRETALIPVQRRQGENSGERRYQGNQSNDHIGAGAASELGHIELQMPRGVKIPRVVS